MYIARATHIRSENKSEYKKQIKKAIEGLEDYSIIESRHNSNENGYKAEIVYGFYVSDYDY